MATTDKPKRQPSLRKRFPNEYTGKCRINTPGGTMIEFEGRFTENFAKVVLMSFAGADARTEAILHEARVKLEALKKQRANG